MLNPDLIRQVALEEFDHDSAALQFIDVVGLRDPYLESLFTKLLGAVEGGARTSLLYRESLLVVRSCG